MLPKQVRIVEVGPRDGLQNEKSPFSVEHKINLINLLSQSGLSYIEGGSFVSPKWVPQMANSAHVFTHIDRVEGVTYSALTPNTQGFEDALDSGVDEVAIFGSASERFSQKNINCSVDESLDRFAPVIELAKRYELPVRGYVSCVMGCPYEGDIPPENVAHIAQRLHDMGCYFLGRHHWRWHTHANQAYARRRGQAGSYGQYWYTLSRYLWAGSS